MDQSTLVADLEHSDYQKSEARIETIDFSNEQCHIFWKRLIQILLDETKSNYWDIWVCVSRSIKKNTSFLFGTIWNLMQGTKRMHIQSIPTLLV